MADLNLQIGKLLDQVMTLNQMESDKAKTKEEIIKLTEERINEAKLQKAIAKERSSAIMWEEKASGGNDISIEDVSEESSGSQESVDLSA